MLILRLPKIIGYAIIQLPDLVFFVYGRIKKFKWFRHRTNVINVIGKNQSEEALLNLQRPDLLHVLSRLSEVENDIVKVFKKLDDIASANITRISKVEEDNKKLFEALHNITITIDRMNNLNPTGLYNVKVHNKTLLRQRSSSKKEF